MNQDIEKQFTKGAQAIQAQAASRLADHDFQQQLHSRLVNSQVTNNRRSWYWATAAAVALTVASWVALQNQKLPEPTATIELVAEDNMELNLKQYPLSMERKINQPLIQEQQAIIKDLKALKKQLLSI